MDELSTSLWITALGMGLVFAAILVLWLMMVVLTALTADREPASQPDLQPAPVTLARFDKLSAAPGPSPTEREVIQAAAIAVAMALAEQETSVAHALPEPPTAIVSAWQLGMRTRLLAEKGNTRRR